MANFMNTKFTRGTLAVLTALVLLLTVLPMGALAAGYTVDHIDIALNLTATVNIDGVDQNVKFKLTTADKDNVTITNGSGQTMSVSRLTTGSTDTAGNPQIRFEGSFPVGTQSDPVYYTVVLRKTLEVTTAAGKTVSVPVTLTATMHYWDSGNVCPGWSRNPGRQSGIDLVLGNGSGTYQSPTGTLQIQKTVAGAELAEDTTFWFDIYKDGAIYQEDVSVLVEAGGAIGMRMLLNVPLGTYTIVEDTTRAVVAEYVLIDTDYSTEGGQVVINESTGCNGIVNITNTYEKEVITRDLTVEKLWEDLTPGTAHEEILVQLYRDGEALGAPVGLNDANGWTFTWEELDASHEWTVEELNCPEGYTSVIAYADGVFTITNTQELPPPPAPVDLTVTKAWANDTPSLRPDSILVQLYRDGVAYGEPVELNDANGWTQAWTGLDGEYAWTVDEVAVPEGYEKTVTLDNGIVTITNTHTNIHTGDAQVSVTKVWADNGYPDRPTSVTVQLLCGGEAYGEPVILNADNNWRHTWTGLNEDLTWTLAEIDVPEGYTSTVTQNGFDFILTNAMDYEPPVPPAPVDLTVTKAWVNDTPSLRPDSILVQLYRDGVAYGEPVELSDANGWTKAWTGMDGEYQWTADEVAVPEGYVKTVTVENGVVVITNTHTDIRIGDAHVSVTKIWDDNGYPDRPTSVTVQLLCGGETHGEPVVLNAGNNWHHTWYELNEDLTWTITELEVPEGYTSSVTQDGFYFTVTNSMDYEPPTEPEPTEPEPTEPEPTEPEPTEPEPTEPEPTEPEPTEPEPTEPEPTEPEPTEPEPTEPEPTEPEPTEPEPTEPENPPAVVNVPVTGSLLSAWIMVSVVSGIGLAGTLVARKKKD